MSVTLEEFTLEFDPKAKLQSTFVFLNLPVESESVQEAFHKIHTHQHSEGSYSPDRVPNKD